MSDEEFLGVACVRELGCLGGGGVVVFDGEFEIFAVGGVVVEQVDVLELFCVCHHRSRVGEVGVAARGVGWGSETFVRYDAAVGGGEVQSALYALDGIVWDSVLLDASGADMPFLFLLLEEESVAGHAVVERERGDFKVLILENGGRCVAADRVEVDFELRVGDEEADLGAEDGLEVRA